MTTDYRYGGMKLHKQGRGFLGFSSVTAENVTMGTVTESGVKTWNTTFYIPSASYTKTTLDGKMAESNVTMTVTDKGGKSTSPILPPLRRKIQTATPSPPQNNITPLTAISRRRRLISAGICTRLCNIVTTSCSERLTTRSRSPIYRNMPMMRLLLH